MSKLVNKQLLAALQGYENIVRIVLNGLKRDYEERGLMIRKEFHDELSAALGVACEAVYAAKSIAAAEPAQHGDHIVDATKMVQAEPVAFRVGNLVTYNHDEYPGLGTWYVQLWDGESIAARVYGNDREELSRRVAALNVAQPPAVAVADATVGKLRLLLAACNRIEEEAEEFEGPDGLGMGIAMDYWHEFVEALTTARKALAAAQKGGPT